MGQAALIVIDFINDIVDLEGKFTATAKFVHEHHVIDKANQLIAFVRKQGGLIVFVRVGFSESYLDCPPHSPVFGKAKDSKVLMLNSWGTEFHKTLDYQKSDLAITKQRISAFYATPLDAILRANRIQNLILVGVSTDMAVQSTAREGHDRDYGVIVVADACGAGSAEAHLYSLHNLQRIGKVVQTSDLIQ